MLRNRRINFILDAFLYLLYRYEVVREILIRGEEGREELKRGETLSWEEIKSDLEV